MPQYLFLRIYCHCDVSWLVACFSVPSLEVHDAVRYTMLHDARCCTMRDAARCTMQYDARCYTMHDAVRCAMLHDARCSTMRDAVRCAMLCDAQKIRCTWLTLKNAIYCVALKPRCSVLHLHCTYT